MQRMHTEAVTRSRRSPALAAEVTRCRVVPKAPRGNADTAADAPPRSSISPRYLTGSSRHPTIPDPGPLFRWKDVIGLHATNPTPACCTGQSRRVHSTPPLAILRIVPVMFDASMVAYRT